MPRQYHATSNASSQGSSSSSESAQVSNGPTPHAPGGTCYKQQKHHHDRPETVPPKHAGEIDDFNERCSKASEERSKGGESRDEEEGGGMMDKLKRIVKK